MFPTMHYWTLTSDGDRNVFALYERHYSYKARAADNPRAHLQIAGFIAAFFVTKVQRLAAN
jgi:hypothetical protein